MFPTVGFNVKLVAEREPRDKSGVLLKGTSEIVDPEPPASANAIFRSDSSPSGENKPNPSIFYRGRDLLHMVSILSRMELPITAGAAKRREI